MIKPVRKAVLPVGGLGTRFLPATKALPKEMLPVANKPLVQYAFEEAIDAGIEEFIFITGRNKNIITNHFDCVYELEKLLDENEKHDALALTRDWVPEAGSIAFVRQQQPLGLGHAVWCARNFIKDEPFAVMLADEMFVSTKGNNILADMIDVHNKTGGNVIAVSDVAPKEVNRYGIVKPESDDGKIVKICDMVEKPSQDSAPSNIAVVGRYILHPDIFDELEHTEKGSGGEIQLTDAMKAMLPQRDFYGCRFKGQRFDCGSPLGFLKANVALGLMDENFGEEFAKYIDELELSLRRTA